jgi:hypothetical protein
MGCQGSKSSVEVRLSNEKHVIAVEALPKEAKPSNHIKRPLHPTLLPRWTASDIMACQKGLEKPPAEPFVIHGGDTPLRVEDNSPIEQLDKAIPCAYKKFRQLDVGEHGTLEREELQSLALWLFDRFHPGGKHLSTKDLERVTEDLSHTCASSFGHLTFDDFADWLECACEDIYRVRRVVDWQQRVTWDGLESQVIEVYMPDCCTPTSHLTEAAQAALDRHRESNIWRWCSMN